MVKGRCTDTSASARHSVERCKVKRTSWFRRECPASGIFTALFPLPLADMKNALTTPSVGVGGSKKERREKFSGKGLFFPLIDTVLSV
jgi:hypothetical protein